MTDNAAASLAAAIRDLTRTIEKALERIETTTTEDRTCPNCGSTKAVRLDGDLHGRYSHLCRTCTYRF